MAIKTLTTLVGQSAICLLTANLLLAEPMVLQRVAVQTNRPHDSISRWSNGAFLVPNQVTSSAPRFTAIGRDGQVIAELTLAIDGLSLSQVLSGCFARSGDGWWAVTGSGYDSASQGVSFLAIVSPDSSRQTVVRLGQFWAFAAGVASDGVIWIAGREAVDGRASRGDYPVIRRYNRDGKLLGGALGRSALPKATGLHPSFGSIFTATGDKVAWLSPSMDTIWEFSLDGRELRRIDASRLTSDPSRGTEFAACADGSYVGVETERSGGAVARWRLLRLQPGADSWTSLADYTKSGGLYGCDGGELVADMPDTAGSSPWRLSWVRP